MKLTPKYNVIGRVYNTSRQADPYIAGRLLHLLAPAPGRKYLDIGCGTGNYTARLAESGLSFCGVEPSNVMLDQAKQKLGNVTWLTGTAEAIPVKANSFDGAIATLTIHHWQNLKQAFAELFRVVIPGANFILFTALPQQMEAYWLNHYFPDMLKKAIEQMPSAELINATATCAGFSMIETEKYFIQPDLKDLFLYSGKHYPELYFDNNVRHSISSFAALANVSEVTDGLQQLRADIDTGLFEALKNQYNNTLGDYIFIVFNKPLFT
jgi:SAM-dependent methyltransferase